MEIKGPASIRNAAELLLNAASHAGDGRFQSGRVLNLTVVSINAQQLLLRLNDTLIEARLQLAPTAPGLPPSREALENFRALQGLLQAGMVLRTRVVADSDQQVSLKLLTLPETRSGQEILAQLRPALRQSLPRQQSLAPLLANLQALARDDAPGTLPPRVQQAVRDFLARLPQADEVRHAEGLQRAIRHSGIFTEHNLLAARADPAMLQADVRAGLMRIAAFLRQMADRPAAARDTPGRSATSPLPTSYSAPAGRAAGSPAPASAPAQAQTSADKPVAGTRSGGATPPAVQTPTPQARAPISLAAAMPPAEARAELLQQVDAALARIHSQQLASLGAQAEGARTGMVFELPLRNAQGIDLFQLRIQQEDAGRDGERGPAPWSVSLAFELERLGPVRVLVSLLRQQVSVNFWAESPDTTRLFNDHLATLQAQLDEAGLRVGRLQCRQGEPTPAEFHQGPVPGLVDETA